ncbi:MAG: hypothetical protein KGJ43_02540, partial [Acidobacteriota bacterium]|nr:hypothetical protein [Acidobacteriota bacterium]
MSSTAASPTVSPPVQAVPVPAGPRLRWLIERRARILAVLALAALAVGGVLHLASAGGAGDLVWQVAIALLAAELTAEVAYTVLVEHHMGVDAIALVAMVGALALGEELAGIVVGLM